MSGRLNYRSLRKLTRLEETQRRLGLHHPPRVYLYYPANFPNLHEEKPKAFVTPRKRKHSVNDEDLGPEETVEETPEDKIR